MSAEDGGFLSRWSRRKALVRSGQDLPPEPPSEAAVAALPVQAPTGPQPEHGGAPESAASGEPEPPAPTLEDVADLTPQSDFKPFLARHVPPDVRNAAVRKLFADPHFNVMDGLDIYIDDYTKTEPIPAAMLAKMVGAQFLKLVDDPAAPTTPVQTSPSPAPALAPELSEEPHDDHPDLQLQPDDAPGPQGPGTGTG
ncbi:MAG: DUF3306 domain-containing protein [Gammaproteobacteria bacterium]